MKKNKSTVRFGEISRLAKDLGEKYRIKIGVIGEDATTVHIVEEDDDNDKKNKKKPKPQTITNGQIANIHEYGAVIQVTEQMKKYLATQGVYLRKETTQIKIPARSFLRASLMTAEGQKAITESIKGQLNKLKSSLSDEIKFAYGNKPRGLSGELAEFEEETRNKIKKSITGLISPQVLVVAIAEACKRRVQEAFETDGFGKWQPITEFTRNHRKGNKDNPILQDTGQLRDSISYEITRL